MLRNFIPTSDDRRNIPITLKILHWSPLVWGTSFALSSGKPVGVDYRQRAEAWPLIYSNSVVMTSLSPVFSDIKGYR